MKRLSFAAALAAVLAMATGAAAQPQPGDLGIYFDAAGTAAASPLGTFVPFHIYVISTEISAGQEAYEFAVNGDPRVTFTVETFFPPGSSDFGVDSGNTKNYLVGTGGECYGDGTSEILVQWQALLFADADDVLFCLEPATPSSFAPARPGYLACDSPGDLRVYGVAYEGCAVGNSLTVSPPVNTEQATWGSVKSRF